MNLQYRTFNPLSPHPPCLSRHHPSFYWYWMQPLYFHKVGVRSTSMIPSVESISGVFLRAYKYRFDQGALYWLCSSCMVLVFCRHGSVISICLILLVGRYMRVVVVPVTSLCIYHWNVEVSFQLDEMWSFLP